MYRRRSIERSRPAPSLDASDQNAVHRSKRLSESLRWRPTPAVGAVATQYAGLHRGCIRCDFLPSGPEWRLHSSCPLARPDGQLQISARGLNKKHACPIELRPHKIDEAARDVGLHQSHPYALTDIHPVEPAHHPALRRRVERSHPRALLRRAGDNCIETVADAR